MIGKTHVLGGTAAALGGYLTLKYTNHLLPEVNNALQLGVILSYSIYASTLPDLDRDSKDVASKNPLNYLIQRIFMVIGAGHMT